jgi:hypothetical protein
MRGSARRRGGLRGRMLLCEEDWVCGRCTSAKMSITIPGLKSQIMINRDGITYSLYSTHLLHHFHSPSLFAPLRLSITSTLASFFAASISSSTSDASS